MHLWLELSYTLRLSCSLSKKRKKKCSYIHEHGSQWGCDEYLLRRLKLPDRAWRDVFRRTQLKSYCCFRDSICRFKSLTPVWLTTIDLSFCGAQSNLECRGAPEPSSLILTQATTTTKPAYLHPLKSVGVSVYFYVYVCMCAEGDCRPS